MPGWGEQRSVDCRRVGAQVWVGLVLRGGYSAPAGDLLRLQPMGRRTPKTAQDPHYRTGEKSVVASSEDPFRVPNGLDGLAN